MSDITKQALTSIINAADGTVTAAFRALGGTVDLAGAALEAPVHVGAKTANAVLKEASGLLAQAFGLMRSVVDDVTDPLP